MPSAGTPPRQSSLPLENAEDYKAFEASIAADHDPQSDVGSEPFEPFQGVCDPNVAIETMRSQNRHGSI